jgi:hypothetical protein
MISIPRQLSGLRIADLKLSKRLSNALLASGIEELGQLDGWDFARVAALRNCGEKSLTELIEFLGACEIGNPQRVWNTIEIPARLRKLKLTELPLSPRLDRCLVRYGFRRLSDIDGIPFSNLRQRRRFGSICEDELRKVLQRAEAGEFDIDPENNLDAALERLVKCIDAGLARLRPRKRAIYVDYLESPLESSSSVGAKYGLTRSRIGQVIADVSTRLLRMGGPTLLDALNKIVRERRRTIWQTRDSWYRLEGVGLAAKTR